ncbi:glycoside hydrolase 68 family protein [Sphingomonas spermidinifaciens]|uniref:Glycoside hydrolase 68 family protein n=1 Tax=Sphingomonas spermidinifaciens TaxID=1141889 RepID=A0A2A4B8J0_9SPHN|nr:glycoside hydrolase 68 family protein [Sphingomonas spermidinifaciens]
MPPAAPDRPCVSAWTTDAARAAAHQPAATIPPIRAVEPIPGLPALDLWDMWPLAEAGGGTIRIGGRSWWFFLASERFADPEARHDHARIRLLSHGEEGWRDHGWTFAEGFTPGSREWSGSAVRMADGTVRHFFTAAGRRGEPPSFEQRLFESRAAIDTSGDAPRFDAWEAPTELVAADGRHYAFARDRVASARGIKGFRDPGYFRDPADGREHLLFTANAAGASQWPDGVIGLATFQGEGWHLRPPILSAIGVNSELERPHVVVHDGRYYLFWSTHRHRFAPGIDAPSGLYAMVADRFDGAWLPVNGSGLVAANPPAAPLQAYCWWVTQELRVASFVNYWRGGPTAEPDNPAARRAAFGGVPAPFFELRIEGDRIAIA